MRTRIASCLLAALLTAPAAAGPNSVRIGILADMSSFAADIGGAGAVLAAQMAAADHGGKANGKPIEILSADIQGKPDIASATARRWFENEGVDAIGDLPVSSVALAVQQIGRDLKKVLLISAATTTDLTGSQCSPTTIHWADDTNALSQGTAKAVVQSGAKSWFFVTADFAFGHAMEAAATKVIQDNGGKVLGAVRHPVNTADYSSFLLAAQGSRAEVVGIANVGADTIATIKQAGEFGLVAGGQKMAGMIVFLTDVHSLGLPTANGLLVTEGFYWDDRDETRAWSKRFMERHGKMPTKEQANTYLSIRHYLKAVDAAQSEDAAAVTARMKAMPTDYFGQPGSIREDGRVLYDLALYEVKKPSESKYPWDYYRKLRTITAAEAFRPLEAGGCAFVKKG